jgi:hypothetical protein
MVARERREAGEEVKRGMEAKIGAIAKIIENNTIQLKVEKEEKHVLQS